MGGRLTRQQTRKCLKRGIIVSVTICVILAGMVSILNLILGYLFNDMRFPNKDGVIIWLFLSGLCSSLFGFIAYETTKMNEENAIKKEMLEEKANNLLRKDCDTRVYPVKWKAYQSFFKTLDNNEEIEFYASLHSEGEKVNIMIIFTKCHHILPIPFEEVNLEDFFDFYAVEKLIFGFTEG